MLRHRHYYAVIRHGQSTANVQKVISSDPAISTVTHELTVVGREQAATAVEQVKALLETLAKTAGKPVKKLIFYSSDFTRARETAEIVCEGIVKEKIDGLEGVEMILETRLRERNFGELNGKSTDLYEEVWKHDVNSNSHNTFGCESPDSVAQRAYSLVEQCENTLGTNPSPFLILLVAHGDVLQILQTVFGGIESGKHRGVQHLDNAEVRLLNKGV
eukprot:GDKI01013864.1.p1 GENE.GDKI01013864.1~~GDKI01013864.1.p1  ORF type:complete len:217 (-),score=20.90 GDKI01013864.1:297-947(-)